MGAAAVRDNGDALDDLTPGAEWFDGDSVAFQFDGRDLVHVSDIDPATGKAWLWVYESTVDDARILGKFEVDVLAHLRGAGGVDSEDEGGDD